ncbi:hypothetical protein C8R43DRAFT_1136141 [Mycena crocata]|nr:hypothetical protein C8R43DRAFT_1136141 [Mycena crocata]
MGGKSRSRRPTSAKAAANRRNSSRKDPVANAFVDSQAVESDGEGGAVSSELSEIEGDDAADSSMDRFLVPDGTHEEEIPDALDLAEAGLQQPPRNDSADRDDGEQPEDDRNDDSEGVDVSLDADPTDSTLAGTSGPATAEAASDDENTRAGGNKLESDDEPVLVANPETPKRKRPARGVVGRTKSMLVKDSDGESEDLEKMTHDDSMWSRGSAVKARSDDHMTVADTVPSTLPRQRDEGIAPKQHKGNPASGPTNTESDAMFKNEMKEYMIKEQGPALAQAVMKDVLPAIAQTMRENAPPVAVHPALTTPNPTLLSPSPLPQSADKGKGKEKAGDRRIHIPLNSVFDPPVAPPEESPRSPSKPRTKSSQPSDPSKGSSSSGKMIDVSFDRAGSPMTVISHKSHKADKEIKIKVKGEPGENNAAKSKQAGERSVGLTSLKGMFTSSKDSSAEEDNADPDDADDSKTTTETNKPKKKIKYLDDLESYKVNYKPGMPCEVWDEELQDPLLVEVYEDLPALPKHFCRASYTADGEIVLEEGQKGGRVPFTRWPNKIRNITETTISSALTFRRKGCFFAPTRESPAEITIRPLRPGVTSKRLNLKEGVAICVTPGMCTNSHITSVQETNSDPVFRYKSIYIMLHDQDWERWESFMAFCFGFKYLYVNMTNLAIQVATSRLKAEEETNETDKLADMRSPVRQAGSSKKGKKYPFKHSLNPDDKVPVYDATKRDFDFHTQIEDYATVLPEWTGGEIPVGSFIVVGYTASTYKGKAGGHSVKQEHVGANLLWIIVCGTPK